MKGYWVLWYLGLRVSEGATIRALGFIGVRVYSSGF